jgi:F-type H+-transporting ATPase subunit gamma
MANTREIKNRIESVQQTRKITNAMYLIASTKLRKARNDLANTRPYFDALRGEIKRVFRTAGDVDSPYFYPPDNNTPLEGTYGCLVITRALQEPTTRTSSRRLKSSLPSTRTPSCM